MEIGKGSCPTNSFPISYINFSGCQIIRFCQTTYIYLELSSFYGRNKLAIAIAIAIAFWAGQWAMFWTRLVQCQTAIHF